ncbi:hypothetical protein Tco_0047922 [Tanacetum coccineum]
MVMVGWGGAVLRCGEVKWGVGGLLLGVGGAGGGGSVGVVVVSLWAWGLGRCVVGGGACVGRALGVWTMWDGLCGGFLVGCGGGLGVLWLGGVGVGAVGCGGLRRSFWLGGGGFRGGGGIEGVGVVWGRGWKGAYGGWCCGGWWCWLAGVQLGGWGGGCGVASQGVGVMRVAELGLVELVCVTCAGGSGAGGV